MAPARPFGTFAGLPGRLSRGLAWPCRGRALEAPLSTLQGQPRLGPDGQASGAAYLQYTESRQQTATTERHALIGGPADPTYTAPRLAKPARKC